MTKQEKAALELKEARVSNTYFDPINKIWNELDLKNPRPGIYAGVPLPDYLKIEAFSRSMLFDFVKHPARLIKDPDKTQATNFGHQYHSFLLQPEVFKTLYVAGPQERRSNADKDWLAELIEQYGGEEYVYRPSELALMKKMKLAMLTHFPRATRLLLNDQPSELTVVFTLDEFPDVVYKIRLDKANLDLAEDSNIADLKTCENALDYKFRWSIRDHGYDLQAGLYTLGCLRTPGLESLKRFIVVAQEKKPYPYLCQNHDMAHYLGSGAISTYSITEKLIVWINEGSKIDDPIKSIEPYGD